MNNNRERPRLSPHKGGVTKRNVVSDEFASDIRGKLNRAARYCQLGQLEKAEKIYKEVLKINPNHSPTLNLLGIMAHEEGNPDMAVMLISKAVHNDPENPGYHCNLGNAFEAQGKLDRAISCWRKALDLKPDLAGPYNNMGNALKSKGRLDEAISCYEKALELEPGYADAHYNLGVMFEGQGKLSEAISCYRKALELEPACAAAYNNLGNVFEGQGELNRAISCYQKALELEPSYAAAYNNLGNALEKQGELNRAISCYQKAIRLRPDLADAYYNMAIAFEDLDKSDEAAACYRKSLEIKPNLAGAYSHLVGHLLQTCAWRELEGLAAKLDVLTEKALDHGTKPAEMPFISISRHTDQSHNLAVAKSWSSDIARRMMSLNTDFSFGDGRSFKTRVTVGYLSNDFCDHATAHLMLSLFGLHNREEFQIFCYSYGGDDGSYYRARIQKDCDRFVDLCDLSHAEAASCIYEDQVDLLVDLKGYTKGNRLAICALRPAPVQVSYLGFPGTTGADFIDYIITDRIVTPENHARYFSEKFVYLPHCYQVNDHTQAIANKGWKNEDCGLPEGAFVFCSFNQGYKIDPVIFNSWMKILRQVPESVLWLLWTNEIAEENLRWEAQARGVLPERLIFAEKLPKHEHLARLRLAALALDTRIVNGHTTTSDALWAGVPVITLQGSHFASRVSASILTAIGLPELITHSLDDYEALAVRLARSPEQLEGIQQKLVKNGLTEPLFNTPRFVMSLEKAYKHIWQIFLDGQKPRQIEVWEG